MSNFDLIDDYLTNRLSEGERAQFEAQMESDSTLKTDVEFQRAVLEGVKQARVRELKAILNNVPVGGGLSSGAAGGKIAAAVIGAGIIGTSLYFYFKPDERQTSQAGAAVTESRNESKDSTSKAVVVVPADDNQSASKIAESGKTATQPQQASRKEEPAKEVDNHPAKIEVTDPSDELVNNTSKDTKTVTGENTTLTASKINVETETGNKKYNFHYQFTDGKLILYGPFDKSLYEILEIHGEHNTIFLYYKENYYLLDEKQQVVSQLNPIKDATLVKKLKEYRGN